MDTFSNYLPQLMETPLFAGIQAEDIAAMLHCLGAKRRAYAKHEWIVLTGERMQELGLVISGRVQLLQEDYIGNRHILAEIAPHALFAEAFVCARDNTMPLSVLSVEASEILFLNYRRILTTCSSACRFHSQLIANMLAIMAENNIYLNRKLYHLSRRSTRDKLLSYLYEHAAKAGSDRFSIPFNRQELADYLCVERSAMSAELSRMRNEGLLDFDRNQFVLYEKRDPIDYTGPAQ